MILGKRYQTQKRLKKESQNKSTHVSKGKGKVRVSSYLQHACTVSPQTKLSQILPSVALYFHPSMDLYRVSSKRTIIDFSLSGFTFSSPCGFIPCLLRENYHEFFPQWPYIFTPQWILSVSPQREFSRILPSVVFHFHPQWIPFLLRKKFHGFYPQWFSFYFKSPTVLSSKRPFILFL